MALNPNDLMFQTEIDVQERPKPQKLPKLSLEETLNQQSVERPPVLANFEHQGDEQFKSIIGSICRRSKLTTEQMEESILMRMKTANTSRSWQRVSGAKQAPMKLLLS